jgi:hypothetical protein
MFFLVVHMMFKRPLAFPFFSSKLTFIIPKCDLPHFLPSHSSHRGDLISQVPKSEADSHFMHVGKATMTSYRRWKEFPTEHSVVTKGEA